MPRPIRAVLSAPALRHNYALAKRQAGGARAWAVVKANAYGHGLHFAAEALRDAADGFAMLDFAEAQSLRDLGIRQPLLMLEGAFDASDVALAASLDLQLTAHCEDQLRMLELARPARPIAVSVKLNTGMNRLGFPAEMARSVVERLSTLEAVGDITLMMHFARAEEADGIDAQLARFDAAVAGLDLPHSLANSAALMRFPQTARDWVRPGIMLYGGSPLTQSAASLDLRPVMHLESRIIGVQEIAAGDAVGYGGLFVAPAPMRIGVVACGYADGYPRHAPTGAPILVEGVRSRVLGRVSMDMLACDLTGLPQAQIGSPVVLWGQGLAADELATAAGTISYELFCALARRVPLSIEA
ncbi:alanine racemase [Niveibacterium sp. SC-1]|uniref:alanine racemase n=1 Tax=Niveibacterium sp. SC-1 TaxID=3135646 RepID=UPI00311EB9B5